MTGAWSLGLLIGLPVTILLVLICIGWIVFVIKTTDPRSDWERTDRRVGVLIGVAAALIVVGIAASPLGFYPYQAQYHRWEPVQGTVDQVAKRIVNDGDGITEKFVVRFEGNQQEYGCEDTRCAVVDRGDQVSLACIRVWQYAGLDGYDCRFVENRGQT